MSQDGFLDPLAETAELIAAGRADEALGRCERLVASGRASGMTHAALGRVLLALGRSDEAVTVLREAERLSPHTPEILLAFGEALAAHGALPAAIGELQRAVRLAPRDARPHLAIARLWLDAGEADKALESLATAQEVDDVVVAEAEAITTRAQQIMSLARADAGYVRHLFDQFAADYDERMQQRLGYAAPQLLQGLAAMLTDAGAKPLMLDLGCGTGLGGVAFRDLAGPITGIDLSPRMLEKARATGAYAQLLEGDIERLPTAVAGPFGLVVAADVLVYLGDLDAVFAGVRQRLAADGLWLFTTERSDDLPFAAGPKRRYRHSADYLRGLAARHGFDVCSLVECACRFEAGIAVPSWAAAFRAV